MVPAFEWSFFFVAYITYSSYKLSVKCVILEFRTKSRVSELRAYYHSLDRMYIKSNKAEITI